MRSIEDTAPSRSEQARLEELWEVSRLSYEQTRRRQLCVEWIAHHQYLCGVFRSHADHHAREQERYQRILAEESKDAE